MQVPKIKTFVAEGSLDVRQDYRIKFQGSKMEAERILIKGGSVTQDRTTVDLKGQDGVTLVRFLDLLILRKICLEEWDENPLWCLGGYLDWENCSVRIPEDSLLPIG